MKTTVIYHSADFDGIFCREIARKFLPDAELIGWDFRDDPLPIPDGQLVIMDLPCDRVFGFDFKKPETIPPQFAASGNLNVIWIDHHKTAIETHPVEIPGYRIEGVAACRLAWQWFTNNRGNIFPPEFTSNDFFNRRVCEPLAVQLAGEYDVWDKRDPRAELFQHGLRSQELTELTWRVLLCYDAEPEVTGLLQRGEALQYARTRENESIIKEMGFTIQWEGLTFLACNAARYNSLLFAAGLKPEHDACFGFKWTGRDWSVSLYGIPGKPDIDLSKIAVKHGGGGHKQACGFRTASLPFFGNHEAELLVWLDTLNITSENIGDIRRSCFTPFNSRWNSFVRDETAARENRSNPTADQQVRPATDGTRTAEKTQSI